VQTPKSVVCCDECYAQPLQLSACTQLVHGYCCMHAPYGICEHRGTTASGVCGPASHGHTGGFAHARRHAVTYYATPGGVAPQGVLPRASCGGKATGAVARLQGHVVHLAFLQAAGCQHATGLLMCCHNSGLGRPSAAVRRLQQLLSSAQHARGPHVGHVARPP
jgi:hypothetical protein